MGSVVFFADNSELATLTNTFKVNGVATDPTTVSLIITDPTGVITTYTYGAAQITRTGTGVYTKDVSCSLAGDWNYQWTGTGAASDSTIGTWTVQGTAHVYASVEALKSRLGITDTSDDFELQAAVRAASISVEQYCGRTFWRTPAGTVRTFQPDANGYTLTFPPFNDLVSVSIFATDDKGDNTYSTTWAATEYQLMPFDAGTKPVPEPYTSVRAVGTRVFPIFFSILQRLDPVKITGVFGWPTVPPDVQQATMILASEIFKLKDAPFGVAGFGDFGVVRIKTNPMVAYLLDPYRRRPVLVA